MASCPAGGAGTPASKYKSTHGFWRGFAPSAGSIETRERPKPRPAYRRRVRTMGTPKSLRQNANFPKMLACVYTPRCPNSNAREICDRAGRCERENIQITSITATRRASTVRKRSQECAVGGSGSYGTHGTVTETRRPVHTPAHNFEKHNSKVPCSTVLCTKPRELRR